MDKSLDEELTYTAMVALITRWNLATARQNEQTAIRDAANAKITEYGEIIEACKAACRTFGYDRNDAENWQEARQLFYVDAAKAYNRLKPPHLPEMSLTPPALKAKDNKKTRPPIRELVLERTKGLSPNGLKAAEIREFIEKTYPNSGKLHEKTVGMTLYRLLQDGLVRREGHTWFFAPPKAEAKNPGVAAPGPVTEKH